MTFTNLSRLVFGISLTALTVASLTPIDQLPPQVMNVWDKAQHALGFGWLALWGLLAFPQHAKHVAIALLLWGGVIELLQIATGWRYGEWLDWMADGIGILLIYLPFQLWRRAK
jgi:VanZ family protein